MTMTTETPTPTVVTITSERIGNRGWVARITGVDSQYGLAREFVRGVRDYSRANRPRTRGVYETWTLTDGLYEVNAPTSWRRADRYFAHVKDGQLTQIEAAEAQALAQTITS